MTGVNEILHELSAHSGRNDKIKIIVRELRNGNTNFYRACQLALNPFINYGIKTQMVEWAGWPDEKKPMNELLDMVESDIQNKHSSNELCSALERIMKMSMLEEWIVIQRIILKDLKCGVQASTFNAAVAKVAKAKYKPIPLWPCMLVSSNFEKFASKADWANGIYCQKKMDGARCSAVVTPYIDEFHKKAYKIEYFARSGKMLSIDNKTMDNEIAELANTLYKDYPQFNDEGIVLDGELLVNDENGNIAIRQSGNGIVNKAVRGTLSRDEATHLKFVIWDLIPIAVFTQRENIEWNPTYKERFDILNDVFSKITQMKFIDLVESTIVYSKEEAESIFNKYINEKEEGCVVKSPNNLWSDTRATDMAKMKNVLDADLVVVGVEKGSKGTQFENALGNLICESSDGKVHVGVGTGFTEKDRFDFIKENLVGKIVTIGYNARIKNKENDIDSLFLPRFVCFRTDKSVANASDEIS